MSGMSGADSFFYAGLAGGRRDQIDALEHDVAALREWKEYALQQEQQIAQIQRVLGQWQEEAVEAGASALVREEAFKEVTGKGVREYFGDKEVDRRMQEGQKTIREGHGLS